MLEWRSGADAVELRWTESGGPAVEAPTRRGFGSQLIEQGIVSGLGGEARLDFTPAGLVCTLRLPLSDKVAPGKTES